MLADATIQAIRDTARIEDVVTDFVALRKRGTSLIGLCPFHQERSPSFHVHPARSIFKCFGCGKGGDVFTFLQEHEAMSFHEAARWLARRYNIEVAEAQRTPAQAAEQHEAETLHIINEFTGKYYAWLLTGERGKAMAGQYLQSRGIHAASIEKYGLGYASGPADLLHWLRKRGYSIPHAVRAGLCNPSGTHDFMQERIIFPIHSLSGKIIAFAGRTRSSGRSLPKYINTPESPIYQKSKTLYGLFQARKAIQQQDECILVEGYLDAISLYQVGIKNVVASCGTALTEGQLQLIRRITTNLIILYDGDSAGIRATVRGIDIALEQDLNIKIVRLPDGEDPDSFARKMGGESLRDYLAVHAQDFVLFKAGLLLSEAQVNPVKKAEAVKNIASSIAKIPDAIKRSISIRECAVLVQVAENVLTNEVISIMAAKQKQEMQKQGRAETVSDPPPVTRSAAEALNDQDGDLQERAIIKLLLQHGGQPLANEGTTIAAYILGNLGDIAALPALFGNQVHRQIAVECLTLINDKKIITEYYFLSYPSPAVRDLVQNLAGENWPVSEQWAIVGNESINKEALALDRETKYTLARFTVYKLTKLLEQNHERMEQCSPDDSDAMDRYLRISMKIKQTRNQIACEHSIILP